jgi:hypothetical protein
MSSFLKKKTVLIILIASIPSLFATELSTEILVNHAGYLPGSAKICLIKDVKSTKFSVVNVQTGKKAYQGTLETRNGIIGEYLVGDFSDLKDQGMYQVLIGKIKSTIFGISDTIYEDAIHKCVTYFSIQRCGASTTGYAAPCHIDDGRRLDTGPGWPTKPYLDVSGGWHDAGDYRKWVAFTLYGMMGLNKVAQLMGPDWNREQILEELRWGNRYFLNMQNEKGYVMNYCGGDDGMYLSDNEIGTEDDRPIHTEPASFVHNNVDRTAQYNFIQAQALTSRIFQTIDPDYAKTCLDAAVRCLDWCYNNFYANTTLELGAALMAYMELYKTTEEARFLNSAIDLAHRLIPLQVKEPIDSEYGIQGFFKSSSRSREPSRHGWHGPQHISGLCMLYETAPDHKEAPDWKEAIRQYSEEYILKLADIHTFHLAPLGLYLSSDPGGENKIGDYWLRYLSITANNAWGGGVNANTASTGIGLIHASRVLKDDKFLIIAQRQLDWILGANPLNMSTVEEVGHNQPIRFINRTLNIPPLIPGAVMNGIGGTENEQAHMNPGSWQNCEYWTPPTSLTMWLMAELHDAIK